MAEHRPPVICLHGYLDNSFVYRHWAEALRADHEVILVDLKGFGAAPKPRDGQYGPWDLATPIVDLILSRQLTRITLIGHSLGGGIALLVALALEDRGEFHRLDRMVSVAGTAYPQRPPPFVRLARYRWAPLVLRMLPKRLLMSLVLRSVVRKPWRVDREQIEARARPLRDAGAASAAIAVARRLPPPDLDRIVARYPEIDLPTLLLWGRHDRVIPVEVGERLARELPNARLVILEDCGHLPMEEEPQQSWEILREFLDDGRA